MDGGGHERHSPKTGRESGRGDGVASRRTNTILNRALTSTRAPCNVARIDSIGAAPSRARRRNERRSAVHTCVGEEGFHAEEQNVGSGPGPSQALFTDGQGTRRNTRLSERDKTMIAQMYPKS